MRRIASRVAQLNGEGALAVFSRAKELERQGRSIIHLELGEPDFHPAAPVVDAMRDAVAAGRDRYCSTRGVPALREAVASYLKRTRRLDAAAEQVLIAPGCKMALALAMMALIEPGDEVLSIHRLRGDLERKRFLIRFWRRISFSRTWRKLFRRFRSARAC
jgi:aspartate aminotransferase